MPGIQHKGICCVAACGQCGDSGCSNAGGLSAAECCTKDIAAANMDCTDSGVAPCVIYAGRNRRIPPYILAQ